MLVEGDAQTIIQQIQDTDMLPDWVIEEEILFIRHRLRDLPSWSFQWEGRDANHLAHVDSIPPDIVGLTV